MRPALKPALLLLEEALISSHKVGCRLAWSLSRVASLIPLDAASVGRLSDEDEERLDALLHRFNSLTAMVQDHMARALLKAEEEDATGSRKDQRLILEKLGALKPQLDFGTLAELRNRIAHHYPDDQAKQAEILNEVVRRSDDLIDGYNSMLEYADRKLFGESLGLQPLPAARLRSTQAGQP